MLEFIGVKFNFNKMTVSQINSLGTPYDYNSVMHYDRTAFGSGRETIRPKQAGVSTYSTTVLR